MLILTIFLFIGIVLISIDFFINLNKRKNDDRKGYIDGMLIGWIIGALISVFITSFGYTISGKRPTALDVYRDKTEIIIKGEMIDSTFIPKDSVVVFKE